MTDINTYYGNSGYGDLVFVSTLTSVANLPTPFSSPTRFFLRTSNISNYYIIQSVCDTAGRIYTRYGYGKSSQIEGEVNWLDWKTVVN